MKKIHLDKKNFEILITILIKYKDSIDTLYFFGSRVRGDYKKTSDIDIAIKSNSKEIFLNIRDDISESNLKYFVDVIDINEVNDNIAEEIKKNGIIYTI